MRITVNDGACVGAGQCALVAENLFDQDDGGIVVLLNSEPDPADEPAARRAATLCPGRAIAIQE
jgi:ferredoxin